MLSVKKKIPLGGKDRISSFPRWVFHHVRPGVFSRSPLSPIRSDRCLIDIRCWSLSFVIWMPPENWSTNQQVTSIQYLKSLCYTHKAVISSSFHKSHLSQPTPGKLHKKTHKTSNSAVRRGRAPKVANHRGSLLSSGSNKPIEDEGKVFGAKNQPHQWVVSWWSLVWGEGKKYRDVCRNCLFSEDENRLEMSCNRVKAWGLLKGFIHVTWYLPLAS